MITIILSSFAHNNRLKNDYYSSYSYFLLADYKAATSIKAEELKKVVIEKGGVGYVYKEGVYYYVISTICFDEHEIQEEHNSLGKEIVELEIEKVSKNSRRQIEKNPIVFNAYKRLSLSLKNLKDFVKKIKDGEIDGEMAIIFLKQQSAELHLLANSIKDFVCEGAQQEIYSALLENKKLIDECAIALLKDRNPSRNCEYLLIGTAVCDYELRKKLA